MTAQLTASLKNPFGFLCLTLGACLSFPWPLPAGMVQTLDNQLYYGSVQLAENGRLTIDMTNGAHQTVPLDKVRVAQLGVVLAEANVLPKGWQAEDIGGVRASTTEKAGRFTMRVTGGAVKDPKNQQAVHFAYRILRADGELAARVESVSGKSPSLAGIMMRETLEVPGGFVLLGVSPENKLQLHVREAGWQPLKKKDLGPVSLPVWLKLARRDKTVTAYRSKDGNNWIRLEQVSLNCHTEPFPEGSGDWKPKVYAGLAMSGPCTNILCSARFEQVAVTARGLLGTYFADDNFSLPRFSRPDPELKFHWGRNPPALEISPDRFSVRWVGKVEPKVSGSYRFVYDIGGSAKLWVNGIELIQAGAVPARSAKEAKDKKKTLEVQMNAGQTYDLKLEYKRGDAEARVRLGWSTAGRTEEVLPASQISYAYDANSPDEYEESDRTEGLGRKGIYLRSGSYIAGGVRVADDGLTRVIFAGTNELAILNSKIARIVFRRSARPMPLQGLENQTGVFLKNGDFFESEYRGVKDRSVIVSSVLFGQRKFSLESLEMIALWLQKCSPEPARFEVRLMDGSVLRANALRMAGSGAVVEETILGEVKVPGKEVVEIRKM